MTELVKTIEAKPDDDLFVHSGQEGSEMAYRHDQEVRRRSFEREKEVGKAQVRAAFWTMWSAIAVASSVILTALGIWFDVIGLSIN